MLRIVGFVELFVNGVLTVLATCAQIRSMEDSNLTRNLTEQEIHTLMTQVNHIRARALARYATEARIKLESQLKKAREEEVRLSREALEAEAAQLKLVRS